MLLSDRETLIPATVLSKDLKTGEITSLNDLGDLVAGDIGLLLALLNLLNKDLLHLHGADLLCALDGSVPLFDFKVCVNGLVVH